MHVQDIRVTCALVSCMSGGLFPNWVPIEMTICLTCAFSQFCMSQQVCHDCHCERSARAAPAPRHSCSVSGCHNLHPTLVSASLSCMRSISIRMGTRDTETQSLGKPLYKISFLAPAQQLLVCSQTKYHLKLGHVWFFDNTTGRIYMLLTC